MVSGKANGGYSPGKWGSKPRKTRQGFQQSREVHSPQSEARFCKVCVFAWWLCDTSVANPVICSVCLLHLQSQLLRSWQIIPFHFCLLTGEKIKVHKSVVNQNRTRNRINIPLLGNCGGNDCFKEIWEREHERASELAQEHTLLQSIGCLAYGISFVFTFSGWHWIVLTFSDVHVHLEPQFR